MYNVCVSLSTIAISILVQQSIHVLVLLHAKANDTITRTIRISGDTFDKITELAEKNGLSFNSVVNQIIEYGLENIQE